MYQGEENVKGACLLNQRAMGDYLQNSIHHFPLMRNEMDRSANWFLAFMRGLV